MTRKTIRRRLGKWISRSDRDGERFFQCWRDLLASGTKHPTDHWRELNRAQIRSMSESIRLTGLLVRSYAQSEDPG